MPHNNAPPKKPAQLEEFLKRISQIESSGGLDTTHVPISEGIHEGMSAYGQYGLMPNTIQELARRRQQKDDMDKLIISTNPEQLNSIMTPELEKRYAEQLGQKVLDQQAGDEEKAAYSWNMGHNLTPEKIKTRGYEKHPYVEKYRRLKELLVKGK